LRFYIPGNSTITEIGDLPGWFRACVQVPSLESAKMLLLGLGAKATVIDPEELQRAVVEEARQIVTQWGSAVDAKN
jgi:hypothetical protein